jgi:hypothetical protein
MYRNVRRSTAMLAVVIGALWFAVPAQAAMADTRSAAGAPMLISSFRTMTRGAISTIQGRQLQSGATYTLSSDAGRFANYARSETVTADSTGSFDSKYYLTTDVAASSVTLSLTDPGTGNLVVSVTIPVDPPHLALYNQICPGSLQPLSGYGYQDGAYRLSSTSGSFVSSTVTASAGQLNPMPQLRLPAIPPRQFSITVTRVDSGAVAASGTETVADPHFTYSSNPWFTNTVTNCFAPNETVQVHAANGVSAPASVTADADGFASVTFSTAPASEPVLPPVGYGQLTGSQTGQSVSVTNTFTALPGTTLLTGQSLNDYEPGSPFDNLVLASPTIGYSFELKWGQAVVMAWLPNGSSRQVWATDNVDLRESGSTVKLLTNGNLVIYRPTGQVRWQTGTAGTGSANRLVMQQNGNLVLSTNTGALVWSKDTGQVRNAAGLIGYAYLASSRIGSAVYVNGLVQQRTPTGQLLRSAHRTVYLQRYLGGRWQNVLARSTDNYGQLAVGFIQSTVYQYRLLVLPAAAASGATSGSTIR